RVGEATRSARGRGKVVGGSDASELAVEHPDGALRDPGAVDRRAIAAQPVDHRLDLTAVAAERARTSVERVDQPEELAEARPFGERRLAFEGQPALGGERLDGLDAANVRAAEDAAELEALEAFDQTRGLLAAAAREWAHLVGALPLRPDARLRVSD